MRAAGAKIKFREVLLCMIAVMALCVSAVSACACTHHQEQAAAEQPSCHSTSHAEMPTAEQPLSDHFDSGCNCFVDSRVPAIASKSENKKAAVDAADPRDTDLLVLLERSRLVTEQAAVDDDDACHGYSGFLLTSGPSRAPPRL
jgi:hypothetical protein